LSLPAISPWRWTTSTTPVHSVPCPLKFLMRPIDLPIKKSGSTPWSTRPEHSCKTLRNAD
jgi:hypothetical protein